MDVPEPGSEREARALAAMNERGWGAMPAGKASADLAVSLADAATILSARCVALGRGRLYSCDDCGTLVPGAEIHSKQGCCDRSDRACQKCRKEDGFRCDIDCTGCRTGVMA